MTLHRMLLKKNVIYTTGGKNEVANSGLALTASASIKRNRSLTASAGLSTNNTATLTKSSTASLTLDGSTPALSTAPQSGSGQHTATTASFTPPAGSTLVICVTSDAASASAITFTLTDSLGSHLTYTQRKIQQGSTSGIYGAVAIYTAPVSSSAAMTVTATTDGGGYADAGITLRVLVYTGMASSPIGASGVSTTTSSTFSVSYTTTQVGSIGLMVYFDNFGTNPAPTTPGTGCTIDSATFFNNASYSQFTIANVRESTASTSIGQSVSLGLADAHSCGANVAYVELLHA